MQSMHRQCGTRAVFISAHDAHLDESDLVAIINACGTLRGEAAHCDDTVTLKIASPIADRTIEPDRESQAPAATTDSAVEAAITLQTRWSALPAVCSVQ